MTPYFHLIIPIIHKIASMCLTKELSWDACNAHATVYFFCRQHIAHTRKQIDMRPCADTYFVKEVSTKRFGLENR